MGFGGRKSAETPTLPAPAAQQETLTVAAQKVGKEERKRLLARRGKAGTLFTRAGGLGQATTEQAALKTSFG